MRLEGYRVSIRDLELFRRLAATGSLVEAGRQLGVSPALVSERIGVLEVQQGARLFHRPVRCLELTAKGRVFYKRTTAILAWIEPAPTAIPPCIAGNDNAVTIACATGKPGGAAAPSTRCSEVCGGLPPVNCCE